MPELPKIVGTVAGVSLFYLQLTNTAITLLFFLAIVHPLKFRLVTIRHCLLAQALITFLSVGLKPFPCSPSLFRTLSCPSPNLSLSGHSKQVGMLKAAWVGLERSSSSPTSAVQCAF